MGTGTVIIVAAAVLTAAAILAIFGWFALRESAPTFADASDVELVARGEVVYQQHCASCHGVNLEGQPGWHRQNPDGTLPAPPHDDSGHTWHHSDDQLFAITKLGTSAAIGAEFKSAMPIFADILDDVDIWAVLAYIKSRWPADIQAEHARRHGGGR